MKYEDVPLPALQVAAWLVYRKTLREGRFPPAVLAWLVENGAAVKRSEATDTQEATYRAGRPALEWAVEMRPSLGCEMATAGAWLATHSEHRRVHVQVGDPWRVLVDPKRMPLPDVRRLDLRDWRPAREWAQIVLDGPWAEEVVG